MSDGRRHKWDHAHERHFLGFETADGNERHERDCLVCRMRRVTVIPPYGYPWHEWITADGKLWVGEATPPCIMPALQAVPKEVAA